MVYTASGMKADTADVDTVDAGRVDIDMSFDGGWKNEARRNSSSNAHHQPGTMPQYPLTYMAEFSGEFSDLFGVPGSAGTASSGQLPMTRGRLSSKFFCCARSLRCH